MPSRAIIVGIDGYAERPLSSAVNDALAFRRKLLELKLVAEGDVQLFTWPLGEGAQPAKSGEIVDALYDVYTAGDGIDRFFFYYAGHGLLAYTDAARSSVHTALMPADVADLKRHGRLLIDFSDLLDRMSLAGPPEQLYFVDACRDLPYEHHPDVGRLGWTAAETGSARAQSALFAVAPLGTALGEAAGLGVFTRHLLDALDGKGVALEYDQAGDAYVVTMESLHAYTRDAVSEQLKGEPAYKLKYQLPDLAPRGPACKPLRTFQQVEPRPLTIHIDPDSAAAGTSVRISVGRLPLAEFCFPPRANHETVRLPPNHYLVTAESESRTVQPDRAVVDVRKVSETTIRVGAPAGGTAVVLSDAAPLPSRVSVTAAVPDLFKSVREPSLIRFGHRGRLPPRELERAPDRGGPAHDPERAGRIHALAAEPQVTIEVEQLGPPYERWHGSLEVDVEVRPGAYRVRYRLGPEVFSEADVLVEEGGVAEVRPTAAISPLLREALGVGDALPDAEWVSESIGPMQAGILETTLVIVGIKPFDPVGDLFTRFAALVPPRDPAEFGGQPLSIVVAVDCDGWPQPAPEVLRGIRCRVAPRLAGLDAARAVPVEPLPAAHLRDAGAASGQGPGFERVGTLVTRPPGGSFFVRFESPIIGEIEVAVAALPRRATVLMVLLRPDGSVRLSQNLLRLPGVHYPDEPVPHHIPFGKVLRQLQVGQMLFQGGELISPDGPRMAPGDWNQGQQAAFLNEMLYAKWTDPVLSCMAFYAWEHAAGAGMMKETARNLLRYFGGLPDSRIVHARVHPVEQARVMDGLLASGEVPILAESARLLGRWAEEHGRDDAPIAEFARRIPSTQVWSVSFRPPHTGRSPG